MYTFEPQTLHTWGKPINTYPAVDMTPSTWAIGVLLCLSSVQLSAGLEFHETCSTAELKCPSSNNSLVDSCSAHCSDNRIQDIDDKKCIDRTVFDDEFLLNDLVAAFLWFIAAAFATAAGVGGGGIYVPLGMMLMRFSAKPATGLSQCSIFGAALAGLMLNTRSRHPTADRPVIDMDMALILAPMEMAGALLGVIVQSTVPEWLIVLIMFVVLGITAFRTFQSGLKRMRKDQAAEDHSTRESKGVVKSPGLTPAADQADSHDIQLNKLAEVESSASSQHSHQHDNDARKAATKQRLTTPHVFTFPAYSSQEWLERDAATPILGYCSMVILWVVLVVILVVKGGHGLTSLVGVHCHDAGYWVITVLQFVWLFCFAFAMAYRTVNKTNSKLAAKFEFVEGDVVWEWSESVLSYMAKAFGAGAVAGLVGIGGGECDNHQPLSVTCGSFTSIYLNLTASTSICSVNLNLQPQSQFAAFNRSICSECRYGAWPIDA